MGDKEFNKIDTGGYASLSISMIIFEEELVSYHS